MAAALNELRQKSEEHTWLSEKRGHFPEHIKPYVFNVGKAAWEYDWWAAFPPKDDTHWKMLQYALPSCLPYNKLTLTVRLSQSHVDSLADGQKLMLQLCNSAYREWTAECEQVGLEALRAAAAEALPEFVAKREAQRQEYQAQLEAYGMFRALFIRLALIDQSLRRMQTPRILRPRTRSPRVVRRSTPMRPLRLMADHNRKEGRPCRRSCEISTFNCSRTTSRRSSFQSTAGKTCPRST